MSNLGKSDIETLEIKQQNLSRDSNGHNFSHGNPIQAHHIWRHPKFNHGRSREIQMVITFTRMSDSGASSIETLEIEQRNLSRNPNIQNFSHEGPIQAHHISRRSKLNNGSSQDIKIVITFNSDVRFKHITYGDARN